MEVIGTNLPCGHGAVEHEGDFTIGGGGRLWVRCGGELHDLGRDAWNWFAGGGSIAEEAGP